MAHPTAEAASSPAPVSVAEKAADFEQFLSDAGFEDDLPAEEQEQEEFVDGDYLEEPEADEVEEGEEPVEVIDAPVSLNAEEKAVFGQLPAEAQAAWAASETRRNTQVQEATIKAKDAQRAAEQKAASAQKQAEERLGEQLRAFTAPFEPKRPNPNDYADMAQYQRASAIYDHQKAQYDELVQQVGSVGVETDEQKAARIQARDAELMQIPEVANAETRDEYIQSAFALAEAHGFNRADLAENIDATELQFLAQSAKWKADSEELASIKAKAKQRKRDPKSGKFTSLKPGAAPSQNGSAGNGRKSWDRVKATKKNKQAFGQASADWLEKQGLM